MTFCQTEQRNFRGWSAAYLKNDLITLIAVPDIGGRIMAYDLGSYPYLYVDRNLAGKLFSAEETSVSSTLTKACLPTSSAASIASDSSSYTA